MINENSGENNNAENSNEQNSEIKDMGSLVCKGGRHCIYCLTIIGEIEGHSIASPQSKTTKYEHVIPQLIMIEQDPDIEGLLVVLNTVGGDVEAGLAISELIAGMKKPVVSLVLGGGHSIGVPLAVSSDVSFIVESATMTIHPVRMTGFVIGVPRMMRHFEKMQGRITGFVCSHSSISDTRFTELMMNTGEMVTDVGTVLTGEDAVKEGLIDRTGSLEDAIDCLYSLIEKQNSVSEQ